MTVTGAGDEIRTHDPNLGKVVLYPLSSDFQKRKLPKPPEI